MSEHGTIARWLPDRGFGWVQPESGGVTVFLHKNQVPIGREPRPGDRVKFCVRTGRDGRLSAQDVVFVD